MPPARLSRASRLEPWALAAIVAATRIPFFARTLFEFDSVNFAVALFRYDLSQDTPHLPGYVLHVGIAKLLYLLVGDANLSYVLESFFLSIGSVLFVWWGVRSVTDGRVAFYSALVWSLNPIFWFQSCVAAAYGHEAFFTAAFAAYAVRYAANAEQERARLFYPVTLAIIIGVAGAARQTSVMFLAPAFVVALRAMRAPRRVWLIASGVALGLTAIWVAVLLSLAGGLDRYLELTHYVHVVQYNSIFLHGTLTRHLDMIGKMLLFLVIGTAPLWWLLVIALVRDARATVGWIKEQLIGLIRPINVRRLVVLILASLIAAPLAFYTLIFYAKSGYLLNIFAASVILTGIIAHALIQKGILRSLGRWALAWSVLWIVYFAVPLPGTSIDAMHRQVAVTSGSSDVSHRYPTIGDKISASAVKIFMYASSAGITSFEQENLSALRMLNGLGSSEEQQTLICNMWGQMAFFYRPRSTVYDVAEMTDRPMPAYLDRDLIKTEITDSIVVLPSATHDVVLFIWEHHWAFPDIARQVHLERLPMPPYLDAWRITDPAFRLRLAGRTFVRQ